MTEDIQTTGSDEQTQSEDDRFEVKWRKKSQAPPPSAEGTATPAQNEDVESLRRELEQEQERVKNLQDRWQRAAADLANLRRRTEQDRGEVEKFASMLLVQELLPVLDNFERALATIPGNLAMLTWIQGVMLIERHLRAILERQGLEPIEVQGQAFNPHFHEAIAEVETTEAAPGTVVREYQRGYTMHGRVIRPSLVEIAKAPSEPEPGAQSQPEPSEEAPSAEETDEEQTEHIADEAETENVGP